MLRIRVIFVTFLFLVSMFASVTSVCSFRQIESLGSHCIYSENHAENEFNLFYGKQLVWLYALEDISQFNLVFSVPLNFENQAPIFYRIMDNTTSDVLSYHMYNDTNSPNKVINITIGHMNKNDRSSLYVEYWVLIKNKKYSDLPQNVELPFKCELPQEVRIWLNSTESVQSDNLLIKLKSNNLLRKSDYNLITYADNIVNYTYNKNNVLRASMLHGGIPNILYSLFPDKFHYFRKEVVDIENKTTTPVTNMFHDAVSTYFMEGACPGVANLGAALFRANGIPAKQLVVNSHKKKWMMREYNCIHYICEYYCPDYGWLWVDSDYFQKKGITPQYPTEAVVLKVAYPEDENEAGHGLQKTGGKISWIKAYTDNIAYSFIQWGDSNWNQTIDRTLGANIFNKTQKVWEYHVKYAGRNLSGINKQHFLEANVAQQDAIDYFCQSNVIGYSNSINISYNAYRAINVS